MNRIVMWITHDDDVPLRVFANDADAAPYIDWHSQSTGSKRSDYCIVDSTALPTPKGHYMEPQYIDSNLPVDTRLDFSDAVRQLIKTHPDIGLWNGRDEAFSELRTIRDPKYTDNNLASMLLTNRVINHHKFRALYREFADPDQDMNVVVHAQILLDIGG